MKQSATCCRHMKGKMLWKKCRYDPQAAELQAREWIKARRLFMVVAGLKTVRWLSLHQNVTLACFMGHAMDDTIQDTYIRYSRMRDCSTHVVVWLSRN